MGGYPAHTPNDCMIILDDDAGSDDDRNAHEEAITLEHIDRLIHDALSAVSSSSYLLDPDQAAISQLSSPNLRMHRSRSPRFRGFGYRDPRAEDAIIGFGYRVPRARSSSVSS